MKFKSYIDREESDASVPGDPVPADGDLGPDSASSAFMPLTEPR